MVVGGSQLDREREFHSKQLKDKDEIISDLKEKTKTLEDEKQRILEKKETLERDEIRKDMLLEQKNEQLQQLRSKSHTLKAEIKKPATVPYFFGNIAKQVGGYIGETLERNEIRKYMLLEQKNEQLQQLRSENDILKAEIMTPPTFPGYALRRKTLGFMGIR